ncbi:hypothetical protein KFE25_009698 [Diacronema lutheri]|uniref:Cytochrome c domain-containing protein n=2 Tax=Diacronema lutheri TaxID=2081491 RepID=A0A8J6CDR7_DIALT|nr:hypothetical protein KFE25_009698 [Diacronema lutheri]
MAYFVACLLASTSHSRLLPVARASASAVAAIGLVGAAGAADLAAGELLFTQKCAACHAGGATTSFGGNNLSLKALERNGYATQAELVSLVSNGKGLMPAFGASAPPFARFDAAQLDNVAAYVLAQAAAGWK